MNWKKVGIIAALTIAAGLYVAAAMPWGMGYGPMMGYGGGMMGGMMGGYAPQYGPSGQGYGPEYNYTDTPQQPQGYYVPYGYYGGHGCPMMGYW